MLSKETVKTQLKLDYLRDVLVEQQRIAIQYLPINEEERRNVHRLVSEARREIELCTNPIGLVKDYEHVLEDLDVLGYDTDGLAFDTAYIRPKYTDADDEDEPRDTDLSHQEPLPGPTRPTIDSAKEAIGSTVSIGPTDSTRNIGPPIGPPIWYTDADPTEPTDPTVPTDPIGTPYRDADNTQIFQYNDELLLDQDRRLDQIGTSVSNQRHLGETINTELTDQNSILNTFDEEVDQVQHHFNRAVQNIKKFNRRNRNCSTCSIIALLVALLIIVIII